MILITGGTGSLGRAYVQRRVRLANALGRESHIRILSRDEEKQRAMAETWPDLDYVIGDIRDRTSVRLAMRGCDRVLHAAALKQVPPLERAPMEAVRTNVLGTDNVCSVARDVGARVVTISTDKAVEPVGVMGATKLLAEAITTGWGFNAVRYGNVIGSRGSIVPVWRAAMERGDPVTITDPTMTRFLITLDEALDLIDLAMEEPRGLVYVGRSHAGTVAQLARVIVGDHPTVTIGARPGERRHEHLVTPDEDASDHGDHYIIRRGGKPAGIRYSSEVAPRLSDEALGALIAMVP